VAGTSPAILGKSLPVQPRSLRHSVVFRGRGPGRGTGTRGIRAGAAQGPLPARWGVRQTARMPHLRIAQDAAADELLGRDPLALLIGMLLDQQFPMERAFGAPRLLADRLGVDVLSAADLAAADPEQLVRVFQGPPALHRYPGSMAARTQELCRLLVERYDGRAEGLWAGDPDGATLLARLNGLPGFGAQKSRIFLALLGKQYGVAAAGWREAAGAYGEDGARRSVADITGPESLAEVRAFKQEQKQAAKATAAQRSGPPREPRA
jgi:uncharacterized HhH-GPD family protein